MSGPQTTQRYQLPSTVALGTPTVIAAAGTAITKSGSYLLDATSAAFAQALPAASSFNGVLYLVAVTATTNLVTLTPAGADTIGGAATLALGPEGSGAAYSSVALVSDGVSDWKVI